MTFERDTMSLGAQRDGKCAECLKIMCDLTICSGARPFTAFSYRVGCDADAPPHRLCKTCSSWFSPHCPMKCKGEFCRPNHLEEHKSEGIEPEWVTHGGCGARICIACYTESSVEANSPSCPIMFRKQERVVRTTFKREEHGVTTWKEWEERARGQPVYKPLEPAFKIVRDDPPVGVKREQDDPRGNDGGAKRPRGDGGVGS